MPTAGQSSGVNIDLSITVRILITGASGFLGKNLANGLRQRGHVVIGYSRTLSQNSIGGDITNPESIRAAISTCEPEVVFNLASQTDLQGNIESQSYVANTVGVRNLLDAIQDSSCVRRVIWASSQLVCRAGHRPLHDEEYCPESPYGESKMVGEQMVRSSDGAGKEWCIVRPTTVWGPGMSPHYQRLLQMIRRGLYFHVGKQPLYKSYAYIDNIVHQLIALGGAEACKIQGQTFYLADSEPIELKSWCNAFAVHFGSSIPTLPIAVAKGLAKVGDTFTAIGVSWFPFTTHRLKNILTQYVFDVSPIESICGTSLVTNDEGIRRTAEWFKMKH